MLQASWGIGIESHQRAASVGDLTRNAIHERKDGMLVEGMEQVSNEQDRERMWQQPSRESKD